MGIQVGANYKGLGEIRLYMKMGCQDLLMDEACAGESDVMADCSEYEQPGDSDGRSLGQEPVWGEGSRAGEQDQKICLDM